MIEYRYIESPIGRLLLAGDGEAVRQIGFPAGKGKVKVAADWVLNDSCLAHLVEQLQAYFGGELKVFDLTLSPIGTEFQRQVWSALEQIPFGETWNYAQLASVVGNPKAARAVGAANGANPIPIVIPCHRVIGANGSLTGFGGGLPTKRWLLEHEGVPLARSTNGNRPTQEKADSRQRRLFA